MVTLPTLQTFRVENLHLVGYPVSCGDLRNSSDASPTTNPNPDPFPSKSSKFCPVAAAENSTCSLGHSRKIQTNHFQPACTSRIPKNWPHIPPPNHSFLFSRLYWIRWKICTSSCPLTSPSFVWRGNEGRPNLPKTVMRQKHLGQWISVEYVSLHWWLCWRFVH